jgi:hypothetical protein
MGVALKTGCLFCGKLSSYDWRWTDRLRSIGAGTDFRQGRAFYGALRSFAYRHALAIVTDVVLDNVGMREVEERHGVRHGHARKVVRGGLDVESQ